ncbi:MAG: hypothetical protein A2173_08545 [Planctomycetes bacterium RBG_13_44_8b]|nr:MAG: hypothetical protein A2173_08545 [Planctomycetes bacterium RBG_13_44_8b]
MNEQNQPFVNDREINSELLYEYLKKKYPNRVLQSKSSFELLQLIISLRYRGFETINKLNKALEDTKSVVEQLEPYFSPTAGPNVGRYPAVTIVYISIWILDRDFLGYIWPIISPIIFPKLQLEKLKEYLKQILPKTNEY